LPKPMHPGSRVIVVSSNAALAGSPLSGGCAGDKTTQRLVTGYAQDEAKRAGLGVTVTAVLPKITPLAYLCRPADVRIAFEWVRATLGVPVDGEHLESVLRPLATSDLITHDRSPHPRIPSRWAAPDRC
jgi:NAD(P)-dependent dehydrogenase (short-subunit alcohol dehydrogenase family)